MADERENPFVNAAPRFAPETGIGAAFGNLQRSGIFGEIGNQLWGKTLPARQAEFEAAERQGIRDDARKAAAGEREALSEIVSLVEEVRRANPGAPSHILSKQIIGDQRFTKNALRIDAKKMTGLVGDILGMIATPEAPKPMTVAEGAALVSPDGRQLYKNPKAVVPEADPFDKTAQTELAKKSVAQWDAVVESGQQARMDALALDELDNLVGTATKRGKVATGLGAVASKYLGRIGIGGGNLPEIEALESLIDRLTPAQRQGLPGAASDRDIALFKSALPSLIRTPQGNQKIVRTMRAMNNYRIKQAEIADSVFADGPGARTVRQAMRDIQKLPRPTMDFEDSTQSDPSLTDPKLQTSPLTSGKRWRFDLDADGIVPKGGE